MNSLNSRPTWQNWALAAGFLLMLLTPFLRCEAATSINSTSQNLALPQSPVPEQPKVNGKILGYQVLTTNDLGMHCGDMDYRVAGILPPYNSLHSQVIKMGTSSTNKPKILDDGLVDVYFSAASNPKDPVFIDGIYTAPGGFANPPAPGMPVFKNNFWDCRSADAGCDAAGILGFSAYDAFYPPGILSRFPLNADAGLPTPDVERLFLGDGTLTAEQGRMPAQGGAGNAPQKFGHYNASYPVFRDFPFGYVANPRWFTAEGIPATNWDDFGRLNAYPIVRVQAVGKGLDPGVQSNVLATTDTVMPVSGEASCNKCHTTSDAVNSPLGGNGSGTAGMSGKVYAASDDPEYGRIPRAVSVEWAADKNILALHDQREGTRLSEQTPVACQRCHYSPALDLAQVGPSDGNGREQTKNQSMSRVVHNFHAGLMMASGAKMFPDMPRANQRTAAQTQALLQQTCYTCHPGNNTKCLRGIMASNNVVCQDCHGGMEKVGNDFSKYVSASNPGSFILDGSVRVPWADEPGCGSCHTGDALSNLAGKTNVVKSADGINLAQAYFTNDANARPIVPGNDPLNRTGSSGNKRFAEPMATTGLGQKPMLYRFSTGHGGVYCQGCHGSTHAEWPNANANANDNVTAVQLQGHAGTLIECSTCHKNDLGITMKGPHGMHPVGSSRFVNGGHEDYAESHLDECRACHGKDLRGTALSKAMAPRTLRAEGRTIKIAMGQKVACNLCHGMPD